MAFIIYLAALTCCIGLGVAIPRNYTLNGKDGQSCIFYGVSYDGMLNYTHNGTMFSFPVANITSVDNTNSNSSCAGNDTKEFRLVLVDTMKASRLIHTFTPPISMSGSYVLTRLTWEYTFMYNDTTSNKTVAQTVNATSADKWSITLHDKNSSYVCDSSQSVVWTNDSAYAAASLTLSHVIVQVDNIKNNSLSAGVRCSEDTSTTAAVVTSTAMPSTTTAVPTYGGKYALKDQNGVLCVILDAGISFSVPYVSTKTNKTSTAYVNLPRADSVNVTVSGTCGNSTDQLVISFLKGWSFAATIDKDAFNYFAVNKISLTYVASSQYIQDAPETAPPVTTTISSRGWFNTTSGMYYLCNHTSSFDLDNNVTMETIFFDLQAFANFTANSTTHVGSANECVQDTPTTAAPATDNTVPIAVGAALAGLVLIVLVAYFIGRRRARNGYQSM